MTITDDDYEVDGPGFAGKTRAFTSVSELLGKLEEKVATWERVSRDAKERAEDFERAAQAVRNGSDSVTVGRTTYILRPDGS